MAKRSDRRLDVHLNLNVRGLKPSATLAVNSRCDALRREGKEVFKLGLGQSPFPVPRVVVEALQHHANEKAYLPVHGLPELRQAVADFHFRKHRVAAAAEDVLIGPGSKELMFLLQLVYYGDLVIPTPAWVSYAPQAHIIGRQVRWLPTRAEEDWRLTPERLAEVCREDPGRPRIVILNYPSNPTGGTYKNDELKELAEIARESRVVLVSDEIYGELHHKGQHVSIARYYPEGTIVSGGLSKWCGAGGWRLGTFLFPRDLRWLLDAMAAAASETYTSTCSPIQYAAVRAFEGGLRIERYLTAVRRILSALGRECALRMQTAGVHVVAPKGAFYLFADFSALAGKLRARGLNSSSAFCNRLLDETGVAVLPGSEFGRPAEELTVRIAYVDFDGARALASLESMGANGAESSASDATEEDNARAARSRVDREWLACHCEPVLQAIDRLVEFVER